MFSWSYNFGAYYIFTGTSASVIDKLVKYIEKNKLGTVYKTGYKRNPNSGNRLMVFIFAPNPRKMRRWYGKIAHEPLPIRRGQATFFDDWGGSIIITVAVLVISLATIGLISLITI